MQNEPRSGPMFQWAQPVPQIDSESTASPTEAHAHGQGGGLQCLESPSLFSLREQRFDRTAMEPYYSRLRVQWCSHHPNLSRAR